MPRPRRSSRFGLFVALLLGGLLIGGSIWLDRRGTKVLALVHTKTERITLNRDPQGGWSRWYELGVGVGSHGAAPWIASIEVSEDRYDALRIGDSVEVRYLPQLPLYARAADRSTGTVVREATLRSGLIPLLLWLGCGIGGLWLAARIGTPVVLAAGLAWLAAGFPVLLRAPSPSLPTASQGTARVTAITLVNKSPQSGRTGRRRRIRSESVRRLAVPYQVVQLRLARHGRGDSVAAVDAVDSGSVAGLELGAEVPVRYDPGAMRSARLAAGTRSFIERNRYHYLAVVIVLPVLGMLVALGYRWRRPRSNEATGSPDVLPHARAPA